jgi:hypothetical protein
MYHFMVHDHHSRYNRDSNCVECCCESISLKPGVTERISVGYASWAMPIGRLHGDPQISLVEQPTCNVSTGANLPPAITPPKVAFDTLLNTTLTGDLRSQVTDPEGDPLTFAWVFGYGPDYGKIQIDPAGTFTYTPATSFIGIDRFYASVSDGINAPVVFEVVIGVNSSAGVVSGTPNVMVVPGGIQVHYHQYAISFPIRVAPSAKTCEVWKLNLLQNAIDCDCQCYNRVDCFDIHVVKC